MTTPDHKLEQKINTSGNLLFGRISDAEHDFKVKFQLKFDFKIVFSVTVLPREQVLACIYFFVSICGREWLLVVRGGR